MLTEIKSFKEFSQHFKDKPGSGFRNPKLGEILNSAGFTKTGQGSNASVWSNPAYDYVLKVFMSDDVGYKSWYEYCKSHQNNVFVPKIKGTLIRLDDWTYACRLERLVPQRTNVQLALSMLVTYYPYIFEGRTAPGGVLTTDDITNMIMVVSQYFPGFRSNKDLTDVVQWIYVNSHEGAYNDIMTTNNVMTRRNGEVVIIDPIAR